MSWTAPWVLMGLLLLPLLWWLMRLLPPAPRTILFPAISLLQRGESAIAQHRLPWWLILLRLLLVACLTLGLAGPIWRNKAAPPPALRQTLIIDTGWMAASRFGEMRNLALQALDQIAPANTQVRLIPTASALSAAPEWLSVSMARQHLQKLEPMPWAADRAALTKWPARGDTIWISDGLEPSSARNLIDWAKTSGRVTVWEAAKVPPAQIRSVTQESAGLSVTLAQARSSQPHSLTVAARNIDGSMASLATTTIAAEQTSARLLLPLPAGAQVRVRDVRIIGEASSGAVYLLDRRNAHVFIGISSADGDTPQPLRSADFYVWRALQPHADVISGDSAILLARGVNILILPDMLPQQPAIQTRINAWVAQGGVLLLFAGPRNTGLTNALLPITIRPATRSLSGAMSWGKPANLGPWPANSPFAGLTIPADVAVRQQWLTEPGLATTAQSWAQLSDATPLVSAQNRGRGLVVLFHTSANADWSSLALSGLFEQMLLRLLPFAASMEPAAVAATANARLKDALDGYGEIRLATVEKNLPVQTLQQTRSASVLVPPGRYEAAGRSFMFNVGGTIPDWINTYRGAQHFKSRTRPLAFDARPPLLTLAVLLLLLDGLATLYLKGLLKRPHLAVFATLIAAMLLTLPTSEAQAAPEGAFDVRLCAVRGVAEADALAGLQNLTQSLKMRTAIVPGEPRLVHLSERNLGLCSLLYWPIAQTTTALDASSAQKLQRYMAQGGFLLIDSGWSGPTNTNVKRVLAALSLPRLEPFSSQHVLAKSFYLLERAPGGFAFDSLWLESGTLGSDGRTTQVLLTDARLASQWRGTAATQERALRLGVNAVIYALTGTYKADQVHAAGLLERMGQNPKQEQHAK
jgi:Domain of unknown function (DUF4159)/Aerotolerance regulator N-terminal